MTNDKHQSLPPLGGGHLDPMTADKPDRMPSAIKLTFATVWFQVLLNGAVGLFMVYMAVEFADQDPSGADFLNVMGIGSVAFAVLLAVAAVFAMRRHNGGLVAIIILEGLTALGALIGLVYSAQPSTIVGLVLPVVVVTKLLSEQGREWFATGR